MWPCKQRSITTTPWLLLNSNKLLSFRACICAAKSRKKELKINEGNRIRHARVCVFCSAENVNRLCVASVSSAVAALEQQRRQSNRRSKTNREFILYAANATGHCIFNVFVCALSDWIYYACVCVWNEMLISFWVAPRRIRIGRMRIQCTWIDSFDFIVVLLRLRPMKSSSINIITLKKGFLQSGAVSTQWEWFFDLNEHKKNIFLRSQQCLCWIGSGHLRGDYRIVRK